MTVKTSLLTSCLCCACIILWQVMVTGGFGIPSHIKREVCNRNPQLKLPKQQPPHATNDDDMLSRGAPPLPATPTHRQHSSGHNSHTSNGVSDDDSSSVTTMTSSSSNDDSLSQRSVNGRGCHAYRPGSAPGKRNDHTYQSTSTQLPPQQFNDTYSSYSAPATPLKISANQSHLPPTASPLRAPPLQGTTKYPPGVQIPPSLQNGASSTYSTHGVGDYTYYNICYPGPITLVLLSSPLLMTKGLFTMAIAALMVIIVSTVNRKVFVLKIFCAANFCIE